LLEPIYAHTAYHGHFGRTPDENCAGSFTWEKTDKVDALRQSCGCTTATS
jgi:S-adenosylmethionine synthetase